MVNAWHANGTRGSGVVSSTADVLWMSVVRGMRGVGVVCEMCLCLARVVLVERGEWMKGLGLGFSNPLGTERVLDLCLGCGGVGVEWVGAWTRVGRGIVVLCLCELCVWILCVDGRYMYIVFADTLTS